MIVVGSVEEFIQRLKDRKPVYCFEVSLGFKWNEGDNSRKLREYLRYADLSSANLSYADLSSADLSYADLSSADLRYADLSSADLSSANLSYANLSSANLSYANLSYADLSYANLSYANLSYADLSSANLSSANLSYANLKDLKVDYGFFFSLKCGVSFSEFATSLKNCSPKLLNYFFVQSIAQLSWELTKNTDLMPSDFVKSWLDSKEVSKGKVLMVKKSKKKEKGVK